MRLQSFKWVKTLMKWAWTHCKSGLKEISKMEAHKLIEVFQKKYKKSLTQDKPSVP